MLKRFFGSRAADDSGQSGGGRNSELSTIIKGSETPDRQDYKGLVSQEDSDVIYAGVRWLMRAFPEPPLSCIAELRAKRSRCLTIRSLTC